MAERHESTVTRHGLVVQHGANRNLVLEDGGDPLDSAALWGCTLRGRLRRGRRERVRPVVIGDRVEFETAGEGQGSVTGTGVITAIDPRRNQVSRPQPSGGSHRRLEQVVVANLDRLWVVASLAQPPLNLRFVDRILAAAALQGVDGGLVLNKVDLDEAPDPEPLRAVYEALEVPVLLCSATTAHGMEPLADALHGRISALVGLSGVGKTSLLRAVQPGLELRVGSVGERHGHGRHTTTSSRLFWLPGCEGWVADTPGMREFGLWGTVRRELEHGFVEIAAAAVDCRFRDCLHQGEPGCAVREAVDAGRIDPGRYASYRALLEELPARDDPWR